MTTAAQGAPAFEHEGVAYYPLPAAGSFFGVQEWHGRTYLLQIPMKINESPALEGGAVQVCNFDEDQAALDAVNRLLGTSFPMSAFPGR
jgi:hypothetical protein